jgi:glycosyltransferase involved in cell wall biosynthesis
LVNVAILALAAPVLAWTSYLALLALLSRATPAPAYVDPPAMRFDVVVPAHNEELGIASTVQNLLGLDYPSELRRIIVIADNCEDATAARAAAAGAMVTERNDPARRGKGYALAHAFDRSLADGFADAVVVVDADTLATPNLLRAFAARLAAGASAAQAEYRAANPRASWRTRLMHIALTLFHDVRSRARERLHVSAGLRGNGMAFAVPLLRQLPHDAFSVVEDVEYGIRLGLGGHRVHYVGEAQVFGQMVATEKASRSQRLRWEGGRGLLARKYAVRLLAEGLRRGSLVPLDLAADLLVPPLTYVALAVFAGTVGAATWVALGHGAWWAFLPWCAAFLGLAIYVVRGAWLARVGPRVALDLLWAPIYMVWKVALVVGAGPSRQRGWVRTARPGEKP